MADSYQLEWMLQQQQQGIHSQAAAIQAQAQAQAAFHGIQQGISQRWELSRTHSPNRDGYDVVYSDGSREFVPNHRPVTTKVSVTKENKTMFQHFREYVGKHRDAVFTVIGIFLVDHFFLEGKLQKRLQSLVEKVLSKIEATLGGE